MAYLGDDIHRGHREAARAIHHAANVAVQLHVLHTLVVGVPLERVLLVGVAQLSEVTMAEMAVLVRIDLAVRSKQSTSPVTTSGLSRSVQILLLKGVDDAAEQSAKWSGQRCIQSSAAATRRPTTGW